MTAGIPLSGEVLTAAGQRLIALLVKGHTAEFVPHVQQVLQELAEPSIGTSPDPVMHRIAFARIRAVCEDVIYAWALAETYTADADMQRDMRAMLRREQDGMLSDGTDRKLLRTCVQFLSNHEGQYQLGSVTFRADAEAPAGSASPADRHPELEQPADTDVRPALDPVLASARGQYLLATEGSTPTRMDRDGAAKTYATYTSWGYFNRRMWVRRQLKLDECLEQADVLPDPHQPMVEDTSYGKTSAAWRFFEAVPSQLSEFRTPEAAVVADRHLRALFGNVGGECITTLAAWTVMCEEARSFGRSLYDAEQVVLDNLIAGTTTAGA